MKIRIFLIALFSLYTSISVFSDCQAVKIKNLYYLSGSVCTAFLQPILCNQLAFQACSFSSFSSQKASTQLAAKIRIEGLNYSIRTKLLFDDLDFFVASGDKVTIVGENGVGKSTLLKVMSAENKDYAGTVAVQGTVGYLPQSFEDLEDKPAIEHILSYSQREDWKGLAEKIHSLPFDTWVEEFNQQGGYSVFKTLAQMKLPREILKRNLLSLSGGEKTKIHLCSLYHQNPDILLLDEPTNHLDVDGITWLERYLKSFEGALVMVTHDRALIDATSNRISELSPITHRCIHFRGAYTNYLKEQKKIFERAKAEREQQEKEIKTYKAKLINAKNIASASKGKARSDGNKLGYNARGQRQQKGKGRIVNSLSTTLETLRDNLVTVPQQRHELEICLENSAVTNNLILNVNKLSKSLDESPLIQNIGFYVMNKERLVITGLNGTGKTTLLKILSDTLSPDEGEIIRSPHGVIGFLDQEQESIDLTLSATELVKESSSLSHPEAIELLKRFGLYHRHDVESPLEKLSIGCRRKAQLASIVASGANILLLDEPTNHMDIMSLEKIEEELLKFSGIIIAVTHDRYFTDKIATQRLHLKNNLKKQEEMSTH